MSQIENIPELNTPSIDTNIPEANIPEIEQGLPSNTECNVCDMLETISAPGLSSPNYGKDIEDVFSNIDNNFKKLSNHDFIKGENGDTIEVEYVKLNKIDEGIGKELYNALTSALFTETPKNIGLYTWDYDIKNYEIPLVKITNINKEEYIGSATSIVFVDYRFSSDVLSNTSQISYTGIENLSCIVNFKFINNEWVCEIDKSFPRIQYNHNKKCFEWLLNNEGTTISATGIKGDKGDNIVMHFEDVDITNLTSDNTFEIAYSDEGAHIGDPILLYLYEAKSDNLIDYKGYLITYIENIVGNHWIVKYDENHVNKVDFTKNTYEFFKLLNINNKPSTEPAKGIFLPLNNSVRAHVIYNDKSNVLNICAVQDYNTFSTPISSKINISSKDSSIYIDNNISLTTNNSTVDIKENSINLNSKSVDITGNVNIKNSELLVESGGTIYGVDGLSGENGNIGLTVQGGDAGSLTEDVTSTYGGIGIKVRGGESQGENVSRGLAIEAVGNIKVIEGDIMIDKGVVNSSSGFYQTSDERLKEFKGDIDVDLDKLLLLPKKYFTWKLDKNGKMEIGTSAQEVQKLYPELVSKDSEGKLVVAYDKLSIVALRAIDVLNSKNKELEARIERLEKLLK